MRSEGYFVLEVTVWKRAESTDEAYSTVLD